MHTIYLRWKIRVGKVLLVNPKLTLGGKPDESCFCLCVETSFLSVWHSIDNTSPAIVPLQVGTETLLPLLLASLSHSFGAIIHPGVVKFRRILPKIRGVLYKSS